jgi:purine-binding chemotaxis protein CheW
MPEKTIQLVSFNLESLLFGLEILHIQEIIRYTQITNIPNSPDFVEGIVNLRGKVIPVVDLRKKFSMPLIEYDQSSRIIVSEVGETTVGFIVDQVNEVMYVNEDTFEKAPEIALSIDSKFIRNIVKLKDKLLIMLDIGKVLTSTEKEILKEGKEPEEQQCPLLKKNK